MFFLDNLPSLPLERKVKFTIDLVLGTTLITKSLYRMTLIEFKELRISFKSH